MEQKRGIFLDKLDSKDIVFFFGAGASAPFGIPTMEQFVVDFEKFLNENVEKRERELYSDIKTTLESKIHRKADLEAVFSVIDGIISYDDPENLGMLALYFETERRRHFPTADDVNLCKKLKKRFQKFINEQCNIPDTFLKIKNVYSDFFNRIALELGNFDTNTTGEYFFNYDWNMFTTNYDLCLEYYWREIVKIDMDSNFMYDKRQNKCILKPKSILATPSGVIKLFKLHGSINWLIEETTGDVIEVTEKGNSLMGRSYKGELMLYPIAEKELYLEPHISMPVRLNRELKNKPVWIVVGYSFNDSVIQEIFLKNWSEDKIFILIHPKANEVCTRKLKGIRVECVNKYFGIIETEPMSVEKEEYRKINHQIIHKLKGHAKYRWNEELVVK